MPMVDSLDGTNLMLDTDEYQGVFHTHLTRCSSGMIGDSCYDDTIFSGGSWDQTADIFQY